MQSDFPVFLSIELHNLEAIKDKLNALEHTLDRFLAMKSFDEHTMIVIKQQVLNYLSRSYIFSLELSIDSKVSQSSQSEMISLMCWLNTMLFVWNLLNSKILMIDFH
jgi:hypothetical protein